MGHVFTKLRLKGPPGPPPGFQYRRPITIDETKVGGATHTDFPVLVSGTYDDLRTTANGGRVRNQNGFDIRPFADTALTEALPFELVHYEPTTGKIELWVKAASVSHSVPTVFQLAYGDPTITTNGSSTDTWEASFRGVYHFGGNGAFSAADSTANENHGNQSNVTLGTADFGGGSGDFNGDTSLVEIPDDDSIDIEGGFTLSAWIKLDSYGEIAGRIFDRSNSGAYIVAVQNETNPAEALLYNPSPNTFTVQNVIETGIWYLVQVVHASETVELFLDGVSVAGPSGSIVQPSVTANPLFIGNRSDATRGFDGLIDEVRIIAGGRSAAWLLAEYNNQNAPATFYSFGSEVPL